MKTKSFLLSVAPAAIAALLLGMATAPNVLAQTEEATELDDTEILTALIVAIDKQDRTLTLLGARGEVTSFEVGPEVENLDQVRVGDYVEVAYQRSVAVYLGAHGTQPRANVAIVTAGAPRGEKPGGVAVEVIDVSARVRAIDRPQRTVTLEGHDGHLVTVEVDPSIRGFDALVVGELVHARITEAIAVSIESSAPADHSEPMTLLFVQSAQGVSYDASSKMLTLEGIGPAVTFFSDRPYRVAGHVMLPGFVELWSEGEDSFEKDPPNASLSILGADEVGGAIIEIAKPRLENDRLHYEVLKVLEGDIPASGGSCSLFIDGLLDRSVLGSGARGAAGGAIIGAIAGDAGKGAAIGAAVGVVGGRAKQRQDEEAKAKAQAASYAKTTTRVINVSNANGSFTPVTLHLGQQGWQGPRGEIYPTLPSATMLQGTYGLK